MSSRRFGERWESGKEGDAERPRSPRHGDDDETSSVSSVDSVTGESTGSGSFARQLPLSVAVIMILVLLIAIVVRTGGEGFKGEPRAVVFIFEGVKATEFQHLVMDTNKAPNLRSLIARGVNADCVSTADARCARTQGGANIEGGFTWTAGPGLASILSGVDATKHGVRDNSLAAMTRYANSSQSYPSFIKLAKDRGLRTAAVGTSRLLTTVSTTDGRCSSIGILDFECGVDAIGRCMRRDSCNLDVRVALQSLAESRGASTLEVAEELTALMAEGDSHIIVVHINNIDLVAQDPADVNGAYSATSQSYVAQMYLADNIVGYVMGLIRRRSETFKENWLLVGTSDHGGLGKTSGTNPNDDEVVPFFVSTMTSFGSVGLRATQPPTFQMDVAPTVLQWFDLIGTEKGQYPASMFDGRAQGICGTGKVPKNCSDVAAPSTY